MTTCATCRYLEAMDQTCRRYPPTVSVVLVPQQASMQAALRGQGQVQMVPTPVGAFTPIPEPDDCWCGEWQAAIQTT